jgi:hypothetical protein
MLRAPRNENPPDPADPSRNWLKSAKFPAPMTQGDGPYQVHALERGPHWIAWVTRNGETKPHRSVVVVAATEKEAREHARLWAQRAG